MQYAEPGHGTLMTMTKIDDIAYLKDLLETGKVVPVIDKQFPLREVPEALRYLEDGHARGKVVIIVDE